MDTAFISFKTTPYLTEMNNEHRCYSGRSQVHTTHRPTVGHTSRAGIEHVRRASSSGIIFFLRMRRTRIARPSIKTIAGHRDTTPQHPILQKVIRLHQLWPKALEADQCEKLISFHTILVRCPICVVTHEKMRRAAPTVGKLTSSVNKIASPQCCCMQKDTCSVPVTSPQV